MRKNSFTVKAAIFVGRLPAAVWDFTQNYENRPLWDAAVLSAVLLQSEPNRMIRLTMKGNTEMTFVYKWEDKMYKTTLVAKDISSPLFAAAGGSWTYEAVEGGTLWRQTNTLELKNKWWAAKALPLIRWMLHLQTKTAMKRAKRWMEREAG